MGHGEYHRACRGRSIVTLYDTIIADLAQPYNDWGVSATYTPAGGFPVPITYIPEQQDLATGEAIPPGDKKVIRVRITEVADPKNQDQYLIDGVTWYYLNTVGGCSEDGEWILEISRSERRQL